MAKAKAKASGAVSGAIVIPTMEIGMMTVTLIGDSPLLCHRFSEKARKIMLDKQMGKASAGREKKDPQKDYEESLYKHPDGGYGFPTVAFKACAVRAAKAVGIAMTDARAAFHIPGELVKIKGKPRMHEVVVRIPGTTDIRHRGEFEKWSVDLTIRYNARALTPAQIVNLFNVGGFGTGVGEWRPERNGQHGMFHVKEGA